MAFALVFGRERHIIAEEVAQIGIDIGGRAEGLALKGNRAEREDGGAQVAIAIAAMR